MSFIALINDENMVFEGVVRDDDGNFSVRFLGETLGLTVFDVPEDELTSYVDADVVRCRLSVESDEAAGILEG